MVGGQRTALWARSVVAPHRHSPIVRQEVAPRLLLCREFCFIVEALLAVLTDRTTRPPRSNMRTQRRAFRDFQAEFNHTRPHEALNGAVPADLYTPSPRLFPKTLKPITYPGHFETRLVSSNGGIWWYAKRVPVSRLLAGHDVGLEEVDHGLFDVYFGPIWLGRFVEPKNRIFDSLGRGKRRTGGTCKGWRTVT
jgi:putative transposase